MHIYKLPLKLKYLKNKNKATKTIRKVIARFLKRFESILHCGEQDRMYPI